jgi:hypothetical protein
MSAPNMPTLGRPLTFEEMSPQQREFYKSRRRRRRSEWECDYEYNPLKAYDDQVEQACHRDKPR